MKPLFLLVLTLLLTPQITFCQTDTVVYRLKYGQAAMEDEASVKIEVVHVKKNQYSLKKHQKKDGQWFPYKEEIKTYVLNDSTIKFKQDEGVFITNYKKKGDCFHFREYYKSGELKREGITKSVLPYHLMGEIKSYYQSGKIKSIKRYNDNELISYKNLRESGEVDFGTAKGDVIAKYPGGSAVLRSHINEILIYPREAFLAKQQGKVYVQFTVNKEEEVVDAKVGRGVCPSLDKEALRVINSLPEKYSSAILDGKKVKMNFTIPVGFKLQ